MTYEEAIAYVENIVGQGSKLGLTRVMNLLEKLGNPQNYLKIIHVAGTNGKGSTCAMLSSILKEAGYRVGMYTSPHLEEYNERYRINGEKISREDFALYVEKVKTVYEQMENKKEELPTVFELITAVGFLYFYEKKVDILLLEVGLGGRFDATNVITNPLLCIIVSISMDHMDYLGNEIKGIAIEKGGIIKEGRPVVLQQQNQEVAQVIKDIAKEKKAKLYYAEKQEVHLISQDLEGTVFSVANDYVIWDRVVLSMLGEYQLNNCAAVLLACKALQDFGMNLSSAAILEGIKKARWNGRMEICSKNPLILLDGAHNADGMTMLAKSIEKYFKGKKITLLMGVLGDKQYTKMVELLLPLVDKVVVTQPNNPRALDADSLEELVSRYHKKVWKEKQVEKAFELARNITKKEEVLCCAGSLYLIGEIRGLLEF